MMADGWADRPTPLPAPDERVAVPSLPGDLIPPALREWIVDAAERLQVPPEMIAAPALSTAGSVIGRAVGIHPKAADDWIVLASSLWGLVVSAPSAGKTPALSEATRHVRRLAQDASRQFDRAEVGAETERKLAAAAIKAAEVRATKPGADVAAIRDELVELRARMDSARPVERRFVTSDATVPVLGELLRTNPNGLLVLRDELAGWLRTLDRAGGEGDREFYLEAWSGTGAFSVDRIGRGTLHIPALTLTVVGGTQPAKLHRLLLDEVKDGAGDGLLQRFGMTIWPDASRDWRDVDRTPNAAARAEAALAFDRLAELDAVRVGASAVARDGIPAFRFAPDALEVFRDWRAGLETRLRSRALAAWPAYEAHLSKYRSLVPALALVAHLLDVVTGRAEGGVPLTAARTAIGWASFLEGHAARLYGIELDACRAAAQLLAQRIDDGSVQDGETVRAIWRAGWSGLTSPDMIDAALRELAERNWLRIEDRRHPCGGRPSRVVRLHPVLVGERKRPPVAVQTHESQAPLPAGPA